MSQVCFNSSVNVCVVSVLQDGIALFCLVIDTVRLSLQELEGLYTMYIQVHTCTLAIYT